MGKKSKVSIEKEKQLVKKELSEFKTFIMKGNVLDLAVGVIIGGAFGKIVSSLVNDILMPLIGLLLGGLDFTSLSIQIRDAVIQYGTFIQNVIDFMIIAASVYMIVKIVNRLTPKKPEPPKKPAIPQDIKLLEEIRDLLKEQKQK